MGGARPIVRRFDDRLDCFVRRLVVDKSIDEIDKLVRFQKHQSSGVEVIGERTERLGAKPDFGAALPASCGVERKNFSCRQNLCRADQRCLVDAAHAVDRDLLDQQVFLDQCGGFAIFDIRVVGACLRFHEVPL